MCDPGTLIIAATAMQVAGTAVQTIGAYQQSRYEAKVQEANQRAENNRIVDAMERGETDARDAARKHAQLAGAQRAALAANGIDVSFGSASDLMADTAMFAQEEQQNVRENTKREIMGYDINAANFGASAKAAKRAGKMALISGGLEIGATIAGGAQRYGKVQADRRAGGSGY